MRGNINLDASDINPAISIIIPVYNSSKFLNLCLESILNQTMKNYEVIIVNDGSTDSSIDIIMKFKDKFKCMKILNIENSGTAIARNHGLKQARGEYISFIDSDDHVEPEFLETLYNSSKIYDADVVSCSYSTYIFEKSKKKKKLFCLRTGIYDKQAVLNSLIRDVRMHFYMWNKLWKKDLFIKNNITFPDMCFEDIPVSLKLIYFSKKVYIINKEYYNYTKNENSIVSTMNDSKIDDYVKSLIYIRNFLEKQNDYKNYKISFNLYCLRTIITNFKLVYLLYSNQKNYNLMFSKIKKLNSKIFYAMSDKFKCFNELSETFEQYKI